ncbi:hypothetical protein AGMMS49942_29450 [Spirochaetia bacterium]|nr:hypothetical protein AGMMS49942_29450 [Spirochaetia bacterium]
MKKFIFVLAIALGAAGMVSAQGWGNRGGVSQALTLAGTLQLRNGTIALESSNTVYYVPLLERYIGFIEGLKEGAQVTLEGYAAGNGNYLELTKMTLNGKNYDFPANGPQGLAYGGNGYGHMGRGQHGRGGGWCH